MGCRLELKVGNRKSTAKLSFREKAKQAHRMRGDRKSDQDHDPEKVRKPHQGATPKLHREARPGKGYAAKRLLKRVRS